MATGAAVAHAAVVEETGAFVALVAVLSGTASFVALAPGVRRLSERLVRV